MTHRSLQIGVMTLAAISTAAWATPSGPCTGKDCPKVDKGSAFDRESADMDPATFFERLVDHYRDLTTYEDSSHLVQVTQRVGEADLRRESRMKCEIVDGELRLTTPQSQIRDGLGLDLPFRQSDDFRDLRQRYNLWLVPHMALKFAEHPLQNLREGVDEGFTPTLLERVMVDDREMVHLELKSGDGLSGATEAVLDFFINPNSLLIERIDGEQHLSDGSHYRTQLNILPEPRDVAVPVVTG